MSFGFARVSEVRHISLPSIINKRLIVLGKSSFWFRFRFIHRPSTIILLNFPKKNLHEIQKILGLGHPSTTNTVDPPINIDVTWQQQFLIPLPFQWYLARAVFGSASALQSSFYHCDLWMIKRKRNQSLFSPSTINDIAKYHDSAWQEQFLVPLPPFHSDIYHYGLWMIKRKRNQKLLLPSTIHHW